MTYDYIVAGQGLAGTFLSAELRRRGRSVLVLDGGLPGAASPVSAGMFNPVTLRDFEAIAGIEDSFAALYETMERFEEELGERFLHPTGILRVFPDRAERQAWQAKQRRVRFLHAELDAGELPDSLNAPYGAGLIHPAGYVAVRALLRAYRTALHREGALLEEAVAMTEEGRIETVPGSEGRIGLETSRGRVEAGTIVLCLGYRAGVPMVPLKGQVMLIDTPGVELERIVHLGVYVIPEGTERVRVGATYEPGRADLEATAEARRSLTERFARVFTGSYRVHGQAVGIRPATADGRPVAGPVRPNVATLNGLGALGTIYGPLSARLLAGHLETGSELPGWLDVGRFSRA